MRWHFTSSSLQHYLSSHRSMDNRNYRVDLNGIGWTECLLLLSTTLWWLKRGFLFHSHTPLLLFRASRISFSLSIFHITNINMHLTTKKCTKKIATNGRLKLSGKQLFLFYTTGSPWHAPALTCPFPMSDVDRFEWTVICPFTVNSMCLHSHPPHVFPFFLFLFVWPTSFPHTPSHSSPSTCSLLCRDDTIVPLPVHARLFGQKSHFRFLPACLDIVWCGGVRIVGFLSQQLLLSSFDPWYILYYYTCNSKFTNPVNLVWYLVYGLVNLL
jgi:hypothetical protein